jgi:hypothetical protein
MNCNITVFHVRMFSFSQKWPYWELFVLWNFISIQNSMSHVAWCKFERPPFWNSWTYEKWHQGHLQWQTLPPEFNKYERIGWKDFMGRHTDGYSGLSVIWQASILILKESGLKSTTTSYAWSYYRLDDRRLGLNPRQRQRIFPLASVPGAHPAFYPMGTGGSLSGGIARQGRDADHSPYLVLKSRMSRSYISSPPCRLRGGGGTVLPLHINVFSSTDRKLEYQRVNPITLSKYKCFVADLLTPSAMRNYFWLRFDTELLTIPKNVLNESFRCEWDLFVINFFLNKIIKCYLCFIQSG